jgi:hypothetical protein
MSRCMSNFMGYQTGQEIYPFILQTGWWVFGVGVKDDFKVHLGPQVKPTMEVQNP